MKTIYLLDLEIPQASQRNFDHCFTRNNQNLSAVVISSSSASNKAFSRCDIESVFDVEAEEDNEK